MAPSQESSGLNAHLMSEHRFSMSWRRWNSRFFRLYVRVSCSASFASGRRAIACSGCSRCGLWTDVLGQSRSSCRCRRLRLQVGRRIWLRIAPREGKLRFGNRVLALLVQRVLWLFAETFQAFDWFWTHGLSGLVGNFWGRCLWWKARPIPFPTQEVS